MEVLTLNSNLELQMYFLLLCIQPGDSTPFTLRDKAETTRDSSFGLPPLIP